MIKFNVPMTPRPAPRADSNDKQRYSPKWYREFKDEFGTFAKLAMKGKPPLTGKILLSSLNSPSPDLKTQNLSNTATLIT